VDAGAGPAALAAGIGTSAAGLAALIALVTGVSAVASGSLAAVELAVIVLTPLAAFEATSLLPMAAVQLQRSRAAAARLLALLDDAEVGEGADVAEVAVTEATATSAGRWDVLTARGLACGWPGRPPVLTGVDLELAPGRSLAVVGASGVGKTTLLLTLAGLLPPVAGHVSLDGRDLADVAAGDPEALARHIVVSTEDAHVFGTTVLENLRVARGDVSPEQAAAALDEAGLGPWLATLPDGLDTMLGPDARTVSGGERRRLLLARALLAPAPLLAVDEPAEHLDPATGDRLVRALLDRAHGGEHGGAGSRGVVVVTHRLTPLDAADEVLWLADGRVAARGRHTDLARAVPGYREALRREQVVAPPQERR